MADVSCPDTRRLSPQKNQRLDALSPAFVFSGSCRQSKDACLQPVPHHTMGFYITYLQADGWPKLYDNVQRWLCFVSQSVPCTPSCLSANINYYKAGQYNQHLRDFKKTHFNVQFLCNFRFTGYWCQ